MHLPDLHIAVGKRRDSVFGKAKNGKRGGLRRDGSVGGLPYGQRALGIATVKKEKRRGGQTYFIAEDGMYSINMVFYARCLRHGKRYIDTRRRCNFGFRNVYTQL